MKKPTKQTTLSMIMGLLIGAAGIAYGVVRWQEHPAPARAQPGDDAEALRGPQAAGPEQDPATRNDRAETAQGTPEPATTPAGHAAGPQSRADEGGAKAEMTETSPGHGAAEMNEGGGKGAPPGVAGTVLVHMEPLVVNLDEGDQLRYLKISLQIEVVSEAQPRAQANLPKARHEALMYLASLHLSDTQGMLGKQRIHRELQRRIADALGGGVKRVYFDEFVVQ